MNLRTFFCYARGAFVVAAGMAAQASAGLTINMDYTNFLNGPSGSASAILINDAYTGSTSDLTRLNDATAVMDEAVAMVEALFSGITDVNIVQSISVGWETYSDGSLARGGTSWSSSGNTISNGNLNWDEDGSSVFFVDTTPATHSEYATSSTRGITLPGSNPGNAINIENRHYAASGSGAVNNSDMLSVAIHEIMHALGVLGSYPPFDSADAGNDGDLDLVAFGETYEVSYSGGHTDESLPWNGPGSLSGTYYPNVIGPSIVSGTRGLLTDVDALLLANLHGFGASDYSQVNQPFGTVTAVPEMSPSMYLGLATIGVMAFRRRVR